MDRRSSPSYSPLTREWIFIGSAIVVLNLVAGLQILELRLGEGDQVMLSYFLAMFLSLLAHGMWITIDRKRRGLDVGWWKYAAILLGPLAVWTYLILEYRLRALYLIPLSFVLYVLANFVPVTVELSGGQLPDY